MAESSHLQHELLLLFLTSQGTALSSQLCDSFWCYCGWNHIAVFFVRVQVAQHLYREMQLIVVCGSLLRLCWVLSINNVVMGLLGLSAYRIVLCRLRGTISFQSKCPFVTLLKCMIAQSLFIFGLSLLKLDTLGDLTCCGHKALPRKIADIVQSSLPPQG